MKKIFTVLAALAAFVLPAAAATFTFESESSISQTVDGISVVIAKGSGSSAPAYYSNGLRLYAGNTITVSGADISRVDLTFTMQGTKPYADLTASPGTLVSGGNSTSDSDFKTDVWTGSASTVTFTLGASGQRLIRNVVVNGDGSDTPGTGGDPVDPDEPDTPGQLDPDFVYPEPTVLGVPSTTVQGAEYSFIQSNVLVSCTKGAVTAGYFSAHAGYDLTFTATKDIKGIVINGFVKKDFTATSSNGSISYLNPSEDTEADPVVVIKDIDSKSVTISCVKQLRCYSVELYFDENPDAVISGNSGSGEVVELTFDSAEAVYESEFVELFGEENYSVFLFNAAAPDVPYFALDLYPETKDELSGSYSWNDYTLGDYTYYVYGYGDDDFTWMMDGEVTVSKSGDNYTITGTVTCDNDVTYAISFSGPMPIYNDDEYYGDGTESGVKDVVVDGVNSETPAYDLQGRRVGKSYRGIVIRNGKKEISR